VAKRSAHGGDVAARSATRDHGAVGGVEEFWERFVEATGIDGDHDAWGFAEGGDPALVTELGLLVRDGPKRATTAVLAEYEAEGEPLPRPGGLSVVLDGGGRPLCVIRTTSVELRRFGDVDEEFAWAEGEGDRTLATWRDDHLRFFAAVGLPVDDDTTMVLTRFELVWDGRSGAGGG
jgi:uncharacterized protein YhfF